MKISSLQGALLGAVILGSGCATTPKGKFNDPLYLYDQVHRVGRQERAVQGSAWVKVESQVDGRELNFQIPMDVSVADGGVLELAVINPLLGNREAELRIEKGEWKLSTERTLGEKFQKLNENPRRFMLGMPDQMLYDLFLGRVPAPDRVSFARSKFQVDPEGRLKVEVQPLGVEAERLAQAFGVRIGKLLYVYEFQDWGREAWPKAMEWRALSAEGEERVLLRFVFLEPTEPTGVPKKWEARAQKGDQVQGVIRLRWKDRSPIK
jgi:hypothetical protein